MPETRAADTSATPTPLRLSPTVRDVVALLDRYAAADRELSDEMDLIGAEVSSSQRVSQTTVSRLSRLLEQSLLPGVRAKTELDALPSSLRRAGIAAWARQATSRVTPRSMKSTA